MIAVDKRRRPAPAPSVATRANDRNRKALSTPLLFEEWTYRGAKRLTEQAPFVLGSAGLEVTKRSSRAVPGLRPLPFSHLSARVVLFPPIGSSRTAYR